MRKNYLIAAKGSSLIEVAISLFLLSFALLGIAKLQQEAMNFTAHAYDYSKAISQLSNLSWRALNRDYPLNPAEITTWLDENRSLQNVGTFIGTEQDFTIGLTWPSLLALPCGKCPARQGCLILSTS